MSPSMKSKSKSKDKALARVAKEQQKISPKTSGSSNEESDILVNDHSSSPQGTVTEYDLISNNISCFGESEDTKEKAANSTIHLDIIPGCDNDKRDKIRLKNERKHQRQREMRAHELHDRCDAYLMSKKLENLVQKLMAVGFSSEQATLTLKLNDRKLEESIS
ncbi:hypothetical protein RYX36_022575 [Vicia faba]